MKPKTSTSPERITGGIVNLPLPEMKLTVPLGSSEA